MLQKFKKNSGIGNQAINAVFKKKIKIIKTYKQPFIKQVVIDRVNEKFKFNFVVGKSTDRLTRPHFYFVKGGTPTKASLLW